MSLSIRLKLILTVGLPLLISYGVIFALDYQILRNNARKQAEHAVSQEAAALADRFNTRFRAVESAGWASTRLIAAITSNQGFDGRVARRPGNQSQGLLSSIVLQNPLIGSAALIGDFESQRKRLGASAPQHRRLTQALGGNTLSTPEGETEVKRIAMQVTPSGDRRPGRELSEIYPRMDPPWLRKRTADPADPSTHWPDAYWSEPFNDPDLNGALAIAYVCPIHASEDSLEDLVDQDTAPLTDINTEPTGQRIGVLALILPLDRLGIVLDEAANAQNQSHHYALFTEGDRYLAHPNLDRLGLSHAEADEATTVDQAISDKLTAKETGISVFRRKQIESQGEDDNTRDPVWLAYEPVPSIQGSMLIAMFESEVMGPVNDRIARRALAGVVQLSILVLLVYVLSVRLVRPIEKLNTAVKSLSQGDLEAQASVDAGDEIGELARAFNQMVDELREHVDEITKQTAAREKAESELRIARQIQVSLLPHALPSGPGSERFDLAAVNRPARHIAGDFYDYFFDRDGHLFVLIADVSGKGVPAALLMAVTRTLLRHHAKAGRSPAEAVRRTGEKLYEDNPGTMFVTLFMLRYNPATGEVVYVNAGHPKPCLVDADGTPSWFGEITAPLQGIATEEEIGGVEEARDVLNPGQSLLLFTDGITEARNPHTDTMLQEQGLLDLVMKLGPMSALDFCDHIADDVSAFQDNRLIDDLTAVVLKRTS